MINNIEIYKGDTVFWGDDDNYTDLYEFCREKRVDPENRERIEKTSKRISFTDKLLLLFKSIWRRFSI